MFSDCAEQVASSVDSDKPMSSSLVKRSVQPSSNFAQPPREPSVYVDRNVPAKNSESQKSEEKSSKAVALPRLDETLDIRKSESKRENSESINDFYNRGRTHDDKVQQKRYADFSDGEPVSLTIRNDISQKFVPKRHNENAAGGAKNQNSYDKKFNQSNAKPSVSNVFSSLNDYINAPSGSVDRTDSSVDREARNPKVDNALGVPSKHAKTLEENASASNSGEENTSDDSGASTNDETSNVDKFLNSSSSRYQNILLPVKYETLSSSVKTDVRDARSLPEVANIVAIGGSSGISLNSGGISIISGGVSVTSGVIEINSGTFEDSVSSYKEATGGTVVDATLTSGSSKYAKNSDLQSSRVEHVYENVYIPTDVESVRKIYSSKSQTAYRSSERDEAKHVYENVDFDVKPSDSDAKELAYERIYVDQNSSIPEVVADPVSGRKTIKKTSDGAEKATFKSLNSNASTNDRKPVIGFSTIDDLSEEELKKYLADLEAEERAIEGKALYENVSYSEPVREDCPIRHAASSSRKLEQDDEDANEAPIFETVTIGELPIVSEEKLQEKAKKFPVIDYGSQKGPSAGAAEPRTSDFLERKRPEKSRAAARTTSEARVRERRSKKLGDRNDRSSEEMSDTDSQTGLENRGIVERSLHADETTVSVVEHIENNSCDNNHRTVSVHTSAAEDLSSRINETRENKPDVADLGCPREETTEVHAELAADREASKVNRAELEPMGSNVPVVNSAADNSGDSNDDSGAFGAPIPEENGVGNSREANEQSEEDLEDKPSRPQTLDIVSTVSMDNSATRGTVYLFICLKNYFALLKKIEPSWPPALGSGTL